MPMKLKEYEPNAALDNDPRLAGMRSIWFTPDNPHVTTDGTAGPTIATTGTTAQMQARTAAFSATVVQHQFIHVKIADIASNGRIFLDSLLETAATSGNCRWTGTARSYATPTAGAAVDDAAGTALVVQTDAAPGTANRVRRSTFIIANTGDAAATPVNHPRDNMLSIRMTRDAAHVDDTINANTVIVTGYQLRYETGV